MLVFVLNNSCGLAFDIAWLRSCIQKHEKRAVRLFSWLERIENGRVSASTDYLRIVCLWVGRLSDEVTGVSAAAISLSFAVICRFDYAEVNGKDLVAWPEWIPAVWDIVALEEKVLVDFLAARCIKRLID